MVKNFNKGPFFIKEESEGHCKAVSNFYLREILQRSSIRVTLILQNIYLFRNLRIHNNLR